MNSQIWLLSSPLYMAPFQCRRIDRELFTGRQPRGVEQSGEVRDGPVTWAYAGYVWPHTTPYIPTTHYPTNLPTSLLSPFALLILLWCILLGFLIMSCIFLNIHLTWEMGFIFYCCLCLFWGRGPLEQKWSHFGSSWCSAAAVFQTSPLLEDLCSYGIVRSTLHPAGDVGLRVHVACLVLPTHHPSPCPSSSPPSCNRMQPSV